MVLALARVLQVVVDGGGAVLAHVPVGGDGALDRRRQGGDLGEYLGARTRLFRCFALHAYIIIYAYAECKRKNRGACINFSVHPSVP